MNSKAIRILISLGVFGGVAFLVYKLLQEKGQEEGTGPAPEIKEDPKVLEMREKYKNINSIDDFIEGSKYVKQPIQFGYDFKILAKYKDKLNKMEIDKVKEIYELLKKTVTEKTEEDNLKVMKFFEELMKP